MNQLLIVWRGCDGGMESLEEKSADLDTQPRYYLHKTIGNLLVDVDARVCLFQRDQLATLQDVLC